MEELIKRESSRPCLSLFPGTLRTQQTWSEGSWRIWGTCWCHLRRSTRPAQTTPRPPLYRCQTPEPSSPWYSEIILSERKKNLHKILLVATGWWWRRWSFDFSFECLMLWQYVVGLYPVIQLWRLSWVKYIYLDELLLLVFYTRRELKTVPLGVFIGAMGGYYKPVDFID